MEPDRATVPRLLQSVLREPAIVKQDAVGPRGEAAAYERLHG